MLYTDINDVKSSAGHIQMRGSLDVIREDIVAVENELVTKYIGKALYDDLVGKLDNIIDGSDDHTLLQHIRRYVSAKALHRGASKVNVQYDKSGISSEMSETTKPVREWMLNDVKAQMLNDACEYLDILLSYLEANKVNLPLWANSAQFTSNKKRTVNSLVLFEEYFSLNGSYSTFYNLQSAMGYVDDVELRELLGEDFYTEIKTQILSGSVSADNKVLLERYVYRIAVYATVLRALKTTAVSLINGGIKINEYISTVESSRVQRNADVKERELLIKELENNCLHLSEKLRCYLNDNASATKYAAWYTSDLYVDPNPIEAETEEEDDDNLGFFTLG